MNSESREELGGGKEALPATEVAGLRAEMSAKISEALNLGVFTTDEASQWEAGFEACTELEHMENLVEIIDDFISSGWEVVAKLENLLAAKELTEGEKIQWRSEAESFSFRGKQLLMDKLSVLVRQVEKQRKQLVGLLTASRHIAPDRAKQLLEKFVSTDAHDKDKVLNEVAVLEVGATAEYQRLNQSTQTEIRQLIYTGALDEAEQLLGRALPKIISETQYTRLRGELDQALINVARQTAQAA